MWRAEPAGALTWHAGPPCGCEVALRPRGRAVGGPREARGRTRRDHVAGVHAGPRGLPCRAPRGRGLADGGPTGIVGPG